MLKNDCLSVMGSGALGFTAWPSQHAAWASHISTSGCDQYDWAASVEYCSIAVLSVIVLLTCWLCWSSLWLTWCREHDKDTVTASCNFHQRLIVLPHCQVTWKNMIKAIGMYSWKRRFATYQEQMIMKNGNGGSESGFGHKHATRPKGLSTSFRDLLYDLELL